MHSSAQTLLSDSNLHFVHWGSLTLVFSLVVIAGLIWDAVFVGVLPNSAVIASMASACIATVNHMLDREIGGRPGSIPLNVDAIWRESTHDL